MQATVTSWRLDEEGQLVFQPLERFATGVLPLRLVGILMRVREIKPRRRRASGQLQIAMDPKDAEALALSLLEAVRETQGAVTAKAN